MRFIVDANLPPALATLLKQAGHEADHVDWLAMKRSRDIEIAAMAAQIGAVVITKDEDFLSLREHQTGAIPVIWVRCGNMRKCVFIAYFASALPLMLRHLEAGERLVELV